MELLEHLENGLVLIVSFLKLLLEAIAVFCVFLGVLKTAQLALTLNRQGTHKRFTQIRLRFGVWLVLALEFQLGADILATTLSASFETLVQLVLVALTRTFLNYFLTKELADERKQQDP